MGLTLPNFYLYHEDMTGSSSFLRIIQQVQPDEIYNLAEQSHVAVSFAEPEYTANSDALGALRLLEAIRILGLTKKTKYYQASTSELFSNNSDFIIQKETGESSWFGFSFVIRPGSQIDRKSIIDHLVKSGVECRPIVTGNFAKNGVVKWFDYEIHQELQYA